MEKRCPPESVNSFVTPCALSRRATSSPPCGCFVSSVAGALAVAWVWSLVAISTSRGRSAGTLSQGYAGRSVSVPVSADPLAAVLAGGRSTRLGRPKATAPLGGRALIDHPLTALADSALETVVVAKRDTELPELEVPLWSEPDEPAHPLLGIVTALERAARPLLVCGC